MRVTGQEVSTLVSGFKDVGIGAGRVASEMKKVVDIATQSGVNAADVSAKVLQNMDALNKYNFEGGVSGLAKMAAQASLLRIDMSQTLAFAEKVFDPEGAIEMAAAMQRLGVSQSSLLDPLKMMDLAQNDPAELQNQIAQMSKQFVQLGKDGNFEIMPGAKRQMREISKAMGIPYEQLTKMAIGSADLELKMSKIRFPDLPGLDEDKQKMIANMAEMGAGGKYEVQVKDEQTGQTITKAIDELNATDVANLEKMANTAPKTMEELAVSQLSVTEKMAADIKSLADQTGLGVARTKAMGSGINLLRDTSTAVRKTLTPKEMSSKNLASSIDSGIDKSLEVLKKLTDGEISQLEARQEIGKSLSKLGSLLNSAYETGMKTAEEQSKKIKEDYPIFDQLKKLISGDITKAESNNNQNTNITQTEISNVRNTSTIPTNTTPTTTNPSTDRPIEITLNHNIDLKASSNLDTNQIVMALKNTDVQQGMVGALKEAMYSNGLMAPTANKTQLMNSNISASSLA
jgi:16S rRNA U516 pseudouridylate synthase RsuA-like enzyme